MSSRYRTPSPEDALSEDPCIAAAAKSARQFPEQQAGGPSGTLPAFHKPNNKIKNNLDYAIEAMSRAKSVH
jgi:hypothetical protein